MQNNRGKLMLELVRAQLQPKSPEENVQEDNPDLIITDLENVSSQDYVDGNNCNVEEQYQIFINNLETMPLKISDTSSIDVNPIIIPIIDVNPTTNANEGEIIAEFIINDMDTNILEAENFEIIDNISSNYEETSGKKKIESIGEDVNEQDDDDYVKENLKESSGESSEEGREESTEKNESIENENVVQEIKNRKENKVLRLHGNAYQSFKKFDNKKYNLIFREARSLKPKQCSHNILEPKTKNSYLCGQFNEETRKKYFKKFWHLGSWGEKKAYLRGLVDVRKVKKRRKNNIDNENAKKNYGFDCFIPNADGIKVRVCRQFFLSTFGIRKDSFFQWMHEECLSSDDSILEESKDNNSMKRKRKIDKDQQELQRIKRLKSDSVLTWLNLLPKIPSHHCRASTSRVYVDSSFNSKLHMHSVFKEWCNKTNNPIVERKKFCELLEQQKITIFKPRKDQCDLCVEFSNGNLSQVQYDLHVLMKDEARAAKQVAISHCSDSTLVVTMDVQGVLLCPKLLVSKQYYKQKLQLHNFTIYISNSKEVHCYVWHEGDGSVTSNEFVSCIMHFIKSNTKYTKIILISDGCTYQNRNRNLVSALSDYTKSVDIEVEQIYLEKGHTMMEVDSVHSILERLFKPPIYTPNDYISRMHQARPQQPFIIHHLDYTFFSNFQDLPNNFQSIRPGKKAGDPVVTDIRGLLYKNGTVSYKLRHTDNWTVLPQRRKKFNTESPIKLYDAPLKIEKPKFNALQSLKSCMHKDNHTFYDSLLCE